MRPNKLVIITPCYNEADVIEYSISNLVRVLDNLISKGYVSDQSYICYINDGSCDNTESIIEKQLQSNPKVSLINLTRNYGQQNAILAGIHNIDADVVVSIDSDIQDDLEVITKMIEKYHQGYEIVYGCRKTRKQDNLFKKGSAFLFYCFMHLVGSPIRINHSEFRLMSRFALDIIKSYPERTIFLRGLIQNLGLSSTDIYYDEKKRYAGKTKYSFWSLTKIATNAIIGSTMFPIRLISLLGFVCSLISTLFFFYELVWSYKDQFNHGLTLSVCIICFVLGLLMIGCGIVGEYIGTILVETKHKPLYQIRSKINVR